MLRQMLLPVLGFVVFLQLSLIAALFAPIVHSRSISDDRPNKMPLSFIMNELNTHIAKGIDRQDSLKNGAILHNSKTRELAYLLMQADLVVRGQVTGIDGLWVENRSSIESFVTVDVLYHTGPKKAGNLTPHQLIPIVFRSTGGFIEAEGIGMMSPHLASFAVDDEVLVFLKAVEHHEEEEHYRLVDHERGVFYISGGVAVRGDGVEQWHTRDLLQHINIELVEQNRTGLLPEQWETLERNRQADMITQSERLLFKHRRWVTPETVVPFYINLNTPQADGDNGSINDFRHAILAAATTWSAVTEADFTLRYAGTTNTTQTGYNHVNEVVFVKKGRQERAALAQIWYTRAGVIVEADIWINDDYVWDATGVPDANELDLQSALLHEFGHWLALGHYSQPAAAMFPKTSMGTVKRTLHSSDVAGISTVYPVD
ncbi:matrixin family metalloprotease [Chloroflexi bacterium TSY]|nr:matrixin family metalloprotease [Chloroflexi bacterium TSY]